jgi:hypothetical protein
MSSKVSARTSLSNFSAREALIGAVKADQPGNDPLEQWHSFGEDGSQN